MTLMQSLKARFDVDRFFARVASAPARVLMLDYDGTLAPFHADPALATPYPGVVPLLDAIVAAGRTHFVIVSGRWIKDLVPLLGLERQPELWGSHGWERLGTDGDYRPAGIQPSARELLSSTDDWLAELAALGARIERKPASIAFHWRGLRNGQIAEIRAKVFEKWMELARAQGATATSRSRAPRLADQVEGPEAGTSRLGSVDVRHARMPRRPGTVESGPDPIGKAADRPSMACGPRLDPIGDALAWHDFDGGIELRAAGRNKGDVVRTLAAEAGPDAALAYLGDDLTDEDAFRAMPDHGAAVLVRERLRPTAANLWVRPPAELLAFLGRWHAASRGHPRELGHD